MTDELDDVPEPKTVAHVRSEDIFDQVGQELSFLLSVAIIRSGGALVLTKDELGAHVAMMFDDKFHRETGGIRILAFEKED
jgi:hypothetical protein